ncbi:TolC family protein [Legionella fallonii]|uniref:Protein CyaE n=1 Tax=Legionella fallonii LLAP-10 TaxID=1212491 RepID=A0A098G3M4_9GAMM|nr:TolC family protein [Legionella fallonii]CEG56085.1 Outer membrane efflux protein [Legionella fallonii LLAP-10]
MKRFVFAIGGISLLSLGFLSGCYSPVERLAPQSPDHPWVPDDSVDKGARAVNKFELPANLAAPYLQKHVPVDKKHIYNLAELIDLAESANPDTRLAWEQSKQAAYAVGLSKASYLPDISAVALGGQQYTPLPAPKLLFPNGKFTADTSEVLPSLVIKWLLFDFGKRDSTVKAALQLSLASNIEFTGAHQKLIYEVSKAYFALDAERAQLYVAKSALKNTKVLLDAAEARYKRGLETSTQVAIAKRETAKARFELARAIAVDNDAYHALLEAMGLTPTLRIHVADSAHRVLPKRLVGDVNTHIKRALMKRPDIAAAFARVRASEADISGAEASYRPTVAFEGVAYQNIGSLSIDHGPTSRVNNPATAFLFKLNLPLFDGGARRNTLRIARSKNAAAKEEFAKIQDSAIRQVARAYDTVKSSLAEYDSALALVNAANTAYDAALDSYRQGLETFTNTAIAETERARAQSVLAQAHASVLTAAAALAFSTGELISIDALNNTTKQ